MPVDVRDSRILSIISDIEDLDFSIRWLEAVLRRGEMNEHKTIIKQMTLQRLKERYMNKIKALNIHI